MSEFINQILDEKSIAYAIFDNDCHLVKSSMNFSKVIHTKVSNKQSPLWDIFPELVGSEEVVKSLLQKKSRRYNLEKINTYSDKGKLHYYTLTLLRLKEKSPNAPKLLCIVTDTTNETSMEQMIRQQNFEIELLQSNLNSYGNYLSGEILGDSPQIEEVKKFIAKMANFRQVTVLLQGKSGTGKNMVARAIHQASMSPKSPFVEINCASIPSTLLESEIFGYEKGAFTDAKQSKKGLLEEASGGTLFLDEIGELPPSLQGKFLTFLETKNFRRLGSTESRSVDVRIMAATNKDLRKAVEMNEFRQDLYYRINVVSLKLPDLGELGEDVLVIADNFVRIFSFDFKKRVKGLTAEAKDKLLSYSWPGNVRELRNVMERAVIFADGDLIDSRDIVIAESHSMKNITTHASDNMIRVPDEGLDIAEVEKNLLTGALEKAKGNQSRAARLLGLTLDTFRYRMKKYNI